MRRIRVQIADPADLARQGLWGLVSNEADMVPVAAASTIDETLARAVAFSPDVLILGYGFPRPERVEGVRAIARRVPSLRVLVLTDHPDLDEFLATLRAGAHAYLGGDIGGGGLMQAVRVVYSGGCVVDHHVTRWLFEYANSLPRAGAPSRGPGRSPLGLLTPREREVVQLMAQGRGNKEVAALLGISVGTAKTHVRHIFRKLRVSDRTQAVLVALDIDPRRALVAA